MPTVYLLEDDPILARHVLATLGMTADIKCVGHADRLSVARDELPRCRPDVLLSDLGLPDGDGTDLIRDITENATDWHPHILVYSGYSDESRVMEAIEAGADGYLLKGCLEDDLVHSIERVARGESPISPAIARHVLRRFGHVSTQFELDFAPVDGCLSRSEHAVLRLVAQGFIVDEIAERLRVTAHVVATHVRSAYVKLQLNQCPTLRWAD